MAGAQLSASGMLEQPLLLRRVRDAERTGCDGVAAHRSRPSSAARTRGSADQAATVQRSRNGQRWKLVAGQGAPDAIVIIQVLCFVASRSSEAGVFEKDAGAAAK